MCYYRVKKTVKLEKENKVNNPIVEIKIKMSTILGHRIYITREDGTMKTYKNVSFYSSDRLSELFRFRTPYHITTTNHFIVLTYRKEHSLLGE